MNIVRRIGNIIFAVMFYAVVFGGPAAAMLGLGAWGLSSQCAARATVYNLQHDWGRLWR